MSDDYTDIALPYNNLLERDSSDIADIGPGGGSISTPVSGSSGGNDQMVVKDDGNMGDVWIKNFIKSTGWKPKTNGFYLDGGTGYAEFTNVFVSGEVEALTGLIGGWVISETALKDAAGTVGMSSEVTAGDDIRFWAGSATPASAPFRVTEAGVMYASSGTFTGDITGSSGTFSGDITGSSGTFSGTMSVAGLTSGTISSKNIVLGITAGTGDVAIRAGKTDFTNTETGFILGLDDSDADKPKFYIGSATNYLNWDGAALTVRGVLNADDITAGTLTGRTVKATGGAGTDVWMDSSDGSLSFRYAGNEIGYLWASTSALVHLYSSNDLLMSATDSLDISAGSSMHMAADAESRVTFNANGGADSFLIYNNTSNVLQITSAGNLLTSGNIRCGGTFEASDGTDGTSHSGYGFVNGIRWNGGTLQYRFSELVVSDGLVTGFNVQSWGNV